MAEQGLSLQVPITGREFNGSQHSLHWIIRGGRRLVHMQPAFIVFDDQVGKGASRVNCESHVWYFSRRYSSMPNPIARSDQQSWFKQQSTT